MLYLADFKFENISENALNILKSDKENTPQGKSIWDRKNKKRKYNPQKKKKNIKEVTTLKGKITKYLNNQISKPPTRILEVRNKKVNPTISETVISEKTLPSQKNPSVIVSSTTVSKTEKPLISSSKTQSPKVSTTTIPTASSSSSNPKVQSPRFNKLGTAALGLGVLGATAYGIKKIRDTRNDKGKKRGQYK